MDPKPLEFTNTYRVDQQYADAEQDARAQRLAPGPTEEAISPLSAAASAFEEYRKESVGAFLQGLGQFVQPVGEGEKAEGRVQGLRRAVIEGALGLASAPLMAAGAGVGQTVENLSPEMAKREVLDEGAAFTLRHLLNGAPDLKTVPPETQKAWRQPMTLREAVETATALGLPLVKGPIKGGAMKVGKILAEEQRLRPQRGSIGPTPPPEPGALEAQGEVRLNLGRTANTEGVKATMAELNAFAGERLAEHRKRKGHAETVAEGQGRRFSVDRFLAEDPETILLDAADQRLLQDAFELASEYYDTLKRRRAGGEQLPPGRLKAAFAAAVRLAELDEANGRNIARGLEIRKETMQAARVAKKLTPAKLLAAGERLGDLAMISDDALVARSDALTAEQRKSWMRQVGMGLVYGKDLFHAAWIQSLLTNPVTHTTNFATPIAMAPFEFLERMVGEGVNAVLREPEGAQIGETWAAMRASHRALRNGFRLAAKSWRTGQAPFEDISKSEIPRLSPEAYGLNPDHPVVAALNVLAKGLESKYTPGRALIVEDAFWKGLIYDMELSAQAWREAQAENLSGRRFAKRVAELEAKPTAPIVLAAQEAAVRLTLNQELGPIGQRFAAWINAIPVGRVILPFYRWSTNSAKWFSQRTPILAELSAQNWRDITGSDAAARDRAIARIMVGHAVAYVIAYEVGQGTITGAQIGPTQRGLRPFQECPPFSIKSDGECYPYLRVLGPVGQMIGAIASYAELRRDIPEHPDWIDRWAAMGEAMAVAAGQVFINQTAMQGLADALEAITDPNQQSKRFLTGLARSAVPAGVRAVTRTTDENVIRESHLILEAFRSGLPLTVNDVPAVRNPVTGEALHYPAGIGPQLLSPVTVTARQTSPVFKEIRDNRVILPEVPWHVGGDSPPNEFRELLSDPRRVPGVELTPWEHDLWITFMTHDVRINGKTLLQALEYTMRPGGPYWNQSTGPAGGRAVAILADFSAFRTKAEKMLRDPKTGSPNLERDIRRQWELRIRQGLPVTNPKSLQFPGTEPPPRDRGPLGRVLESLGR